MQKYRRLALCSPLLKLCPRVRNVFASYCKEKGFCALDKKKKMILRKTINVGNWFLVGLSAFYLAKSVLHLKYENITVL